MNAFEKSFEPSSFIDIQAERGETKFSAESNSAFVQNID